MSVCTENIYITLQANANTEGILSYADYTRIALYDPVHGYYAKDKQRVGLTAEADFYTASSLNPVFGKLVRSAAKKLLGASFADHTFVEIGAEPGRNLFNEGLCYHLGDTVTLPPKSIVFANELLDAQPFNRFVFKEGRWHELGVRVQTEQLEEVTLPEPTEALESLLPSLPKNMPERYLFDISLEAETLLESLLNTSWSGLIMLFDYGKTWQELLTNSPAGTARAYYKHTLSNKLLERPGEQDLTTHVCWDRCEGLLQNAGLNPAKLERQEAFFVNHAQEAISKIINDNAQGLSQELQSLKELLHPHHMGQKFQVLWGQTQSTN